jgi:uncharacterized protein (DUF427 family)
MMKSSTGSNPAPGSRKYPGHRIATRPAGVRVRVMLDGKLIAETSEAIALEETLEGSTVAPIVYYLPRKDVKMHRLVRTSHRTHCPFKGDASYFSFMDGPENAVWSYEQPYDDVEVIKDLLAFYSDKVEISIS